MVKRVAALLLGVMAAAVALVAWGPASPAAAAANQITVTVLNADTQETYGGVTVTAANPKGFSGSCTTATGTGQCAIDITEGGPYTITVDQATLPKGVVPRTPELQVQVLSAAFGQVVRFDTGAGETTSGGSGRSSPSQIPQLISDGLIFGLILALAGVGLSLIYGTTGLTNFAHGEIVTFGALATLVLNNNVGLPLEISVPLAVILTAVVAGYLQDKMLWAPLRRRGTGLIAMLVVSIGFGILVRYIYLFFFGGETKIYNSYAGQEGIAIGPVLQTPKALIGSVVAILLLLATAYWLLRTKMGKASRAVADNPSLASASGIDVERVINTVWILGAALAGFGGVLYAMSFGVNWTSGFQPLLLLTFAAVTLGGFGTAFGALVGSLVVGLLLQLSTLVIPIELQNVGALVILILVLLVRPQGILGRAERVG